jgi:uroporphyrinogen decarboxylase
MNSRERALAALHHEEPDRIPFDIGGTVCSSIHKTAYIALRKYLGLTERKVELLHQAGQVARLDEDILELLRVDTLFLDREKPASRGTVELRDEGEYWAYDDSWSVGWHMPKQDGLYYDMYAHPFDTDDVEARLKGYTWPDASSPEVYAGMKERAIELRKQDKLVLLGGFSAGPVERLTWLRGFSRGYMDLALDTNIAEFFLDKITELKATYWENALSQFGEYIDVAVEGDDFAGQDNMLISPKTYRELIKPRHGRIFEVIKQTAPHVKIHFHSCGAIRPVIPDLIEIGVDALNPVQISAAGMDPFGLKSEFGKDITFWGGGVDTQNVFEVGTPDDVREDVRRNIEAFAPGGGFIFTTVHNTQPNVPPENFMAMWETLQEYGIYT